MWNKIIALTVLSIFLTGSLSAQHYSRRTRGRIVTTRPQEKNTQKKSDETQTRRSAQDKKKKTDPTDPSSKFDPQKPVLTQSQIDSVMNDQLRQRLLELKIPAKLPGYQGDDEDDEEEAKEDDKQEKGTLISRLDLAILLSHYSSLIGNFELSEVSHIKPEWYLQYQTELRKFAPIINEITIAVRSQSRERYNAAVKKFKAHQEECLKFLKQKPPRLTREQHQMLVTKNSKIRLENYLKQLQAERAAEQKRRQEMLKQQQQKNQPKKPVNQTPARK
ncbi:MAG: hypothetical protein IKX19_05480 [Clostridia bacterium]|nr:hypothetical protein [Lentisphaeria bacterium]MBR5680087.1 hypothetical protein [Clostridia bacterium]